MTSTPNPKPDPRLFPLAKRAAKGFSKLVNDAVADKSIIGILAIIVREPTKKDPEQSKGVTCFVRQPSQGLKFAAAAVADTMAGREVPDTYIVRDHIHPEGWA